MSYANDLAKDRDKYRRQRDMLAMHLRDILYGGGISQEDIDDQPILKAAERALDKVLQSEKSAAQLLGLEK